MAGIKHRYLITGIATVGGVEVSGSCIDTDIIHAIERLRSAYVSVHSIIRGPQVPADTYCGIERIVYPDHVVIP